MRIKRPASGLPAGNVGDRPSGIPQRRLRALWGGLALVLAALPLVARASGGSHEPPATLVYPVDLVTGSDNDWVIADFKSHGLLRLDSDGQVVPIHQGPGLPRTPLYGTRALAQAPDGNGWIVADPATFGLYRVDAAGSLSTITTELDIPQAVARFDDESVLVSDLRSGIGAVMRVTLDGQVTVFAEMGSPKGIVADGDDAFAVVSHGERALFRLGRDGRVSTIAAGPPFDFPHDVVRNPDGSFVVTDGYAAALFRVGLDGAVSVLAQGAPLVNPQGIVRTPDGNYVVVDPQAGAVFKVSSSGAIERLFAVSAS